MDLSKICINPRQRNPWEAVDLGVVLTRLWWPKLFLSWLIPASIVYLPLTALLGEYFWLAYFVVWWLKPIFDRAPLYIASRQLFGEEPSLVEVLRALPKLYRLDLIPWLTYRRFSFTRSFDMPLTVLEQLRGSARASRIGVLHRKYSGVAGWLTIILIHVEMLLMFGFMSLFVLMIPENIDIDYMALAADADSIAMWAYHIISFLMVCSVAPFYALCGFCLYISRRVDLEAWDIEIHFRHLAAKHKAKQLRVKNAHGFAPLLLAAGLAITTSLAPEPVMANSMVEQASTQSATSSEPASDSEAIAPELVATKDAIIVILERNEFHQYETTSRWRLKEQEAKQDEEIPEWVIRAIQRLVEWLASFDWDDDPNTAGKSPVILLELLLWGALIALVVYVIYRYRNSIAGVIRLSNRGQTFEAETPETLFGLDVRKDSLPSDIPLDVQRLWEDGKPREAIGLLYRGFLGTLLHDYHCKFRDSYTEGECVQVIVALGRKELTDYAHDLTLVWQNLAYGHREPAQEKVQALCVRWRELFTHA